MSGPPDEQAFVATGHGSVLYFRTDREGEVLLQGVDPDGPLLPLLSAAGDTLTLGAQSAGDVVEWMID